MGINEHSALRPVPYFLLLDFRMILLTTLLLDIMFVDRPLQHQRYYQKQQMHSKDKGQNSVEELGERNELGCRCVLGSEVYQQHEHEKFHALGEVEMHTEVAALQGLAVNTHAEIGTVHAAYCDNSVKGLIVEDCDHEGEQNLFEAADEPKIFSESLVIGTDEVGHR